MRKLGKYFVILGTTLLLGFSSAGHALAENAAAMPSQSPDVDFQGPRHLSEGERQAARPVPASRPEAKNAARSPRTDLSGFTLTLKDVRKWPTSPAAESVMVPTLAGPVSSTRDRLSGVVGAGMSVTYVINGIVTVASLHTDWGDADLYVENCDGTPVGSSTRGGLSPDDADIYTVDGTSQCRHIRVFGYLLSSYQLSVYNYT